MALNRKGVLPQKPRWKMQKLKRKPLSQLLGNTLGSLLTPVNKLLDRLPVSPSFVTTAALIVILAMLLLGCSPAKTVKPTLPPQADAREVTVFSGRTHRDVMLYSVQLREGWLSCESDKAAIRSVFGGSDE